MEYQKESTSKKVENAKKTFCSKNHGYEIYQNLPISMGKGWFRKFYFDRGLTLDIANCQTDCTQDCYMEESGPFFGFYFCLAGNRRLKMQSFKKDIEIKEFQCALFNFPDKKRLHEFAPGTHAQIVFILISHDHVHSLLGNDFKKFYPMKSCLQRGMLAILSTFLTPQLPE